MSILDGLDGLRVDLMNLHIPDDIAETDNERLYRANAVGRDNGIVEAGLCVREALTSDETRDRIIAALPHADWCCTKGCAQPNGVHYVGDWNAVPLPDDMTGLSKFAPCPGACTCEVGMIVPQVLDALTGGSNNG